VAKIDTFGCWLSLVPGFLVRAKLELRLDRVTIALDMEVMMIRMAMKMMTTIMMTEMIVVITLCHSHVPYLKVQATSAHPKIFMGTQFKLRNHS
jgi:hypothetical protein